MKASLTYRILIFLAALLLASLACSVMAPADTPTPVPTNTPAPTATPAVKLGDEMRVEDQGFAFRPLPGYQLDTSFGVQMLAPNANPDTGPAFMLVGGVASEGTTAETLIASLKSSEVEVSDAKPVTVNGVAGLTADIQRASGDLAGRVVAVMVKPNQQFVMFAAAPKAQWDGEVSKLFDSVLASVKFIEMKAPTEASAMVEATAESPAEPTAAPTQAAESAQPTATTAAANASFETPAGFLWRLGGPKGTEHNQFPALYGMDVDENARLIYIADGLYSVQVIDASGEQVGAFSNKDMRVTNDVKVGPDGKVYVAAWGSGKIFVFSNLGELITSFGERGNGEGQFGEFSPTRLAVGVDGTVYALDRTKDSSDHWYERVHIFSPDGQWQSTIYFDDKAFTPGGMDIGPDGNLYIVGFIGHQILKFSPSGKLLATLAEDTLKTLGGPQGLAIDAEGNFYLAMWTSGMVKLDPDGKLLSQWGVPIKDGEVEWPEGGFYQPDGIAVLADGSQVFFSDTTGKLAYLTAFSFEGSSNAGSGAPSSGAPSSGTQTGELRQWAMGAEATSEYGNPSWAASQATGKPDVANCGDDSKAWASSESNTVESIDLYYDTPVLPTEVNVRQTYNPGQIVKVEVIDVNGNETLVYEAQPKVVNECPNVLKITVKGVNVAVMGVRVTVDQSVLGLGWAEIDAVELVGTPVQGTTTPPGGSSGGGAGNVTFDKTTGMPLMPGAQNVYAVDSNTLNYTVKTDLATARQFYLTELPKLGWLLDLDEKGKCRDNDRCMGWHGGYDDPATTTFFFLQGDHAYLTLNFIETNGLMSVVIGIDPEYK